MPGRRRLSSTRTTNSCPSFRQHRHRHRHSTHTACTQSQANIPSAGYPSTWALLPTRRHPCGRATFVQGATYPRLAYTGRQIVGQRRPTTALAAPFAHLNRAPDALTRERIHLCCDLAPSRCRASQILSGRPTMLQVRRYGVQPSRFPAVLQLTHHTRTGCSVQQAPAGWVHENRQILTHSSHESRGRRALWPTPRRYCPSRRQSRRRLLS